MPDHGVQPSEQSRTARRRYPTPRCQVRYRMCRVIGVGNEAVSSADETQDCVAEYVAAACTCPILYSVGLDVRLMIDTFADHTF